ncbi:hypothetical protein HYFRA_00000992 [Hymenoscyphus fraxineus]|uniref:Uncharacterized protein n=1 Tax=Hymenoscyphus fraxineus TaxID=746836 RepID=A0A9N9PS76_9HELO|nr:hypothetical protein HYFRA_00000992 [Hymenoscyphus fraxineus]
MIQPDPLEDFTGVLFCPTTRPSQTEYHTGPSKSLGFLTGTEHRGVTTFGASNTARHALVLALPVSGCIWMYELAAAIGFGVQERRADAMRNGHDVFPWLPVALAMEGGQPG